MHFTDGGEAGRETLIAIAKSVGAAIGKMHDAEIVHGDLTTSNLMVKDSTDSGAAPEVVVIDFGLGMMKPNQEDKAVDLYVLERAFISTHPGSEYLVRTFVYLQLMLVMHDFTVRPCFCRFKRFWNLTDLRVEKARQHWASLSRYK